MTWLCPFLNYNVDRTVGGAVKTEIVIYHLCGATVSEGTDVIAVIWSGRQAGKWSGGDSIN